MVMLHLQMRLHDGVADALLGQAQMLADTGKQDEAEQVGPPPPLLMQRPSCRCCPRTHLADAPRLLVWRLSICSPSGPACLGHATATLL